MAASKRVFVVTPAGVASYVNLFEPYSESGKYQLNIIFPPSADMKALEEEVDRVAKEKWPKGLPKKFKHPFRDCDEKAGQAGYDNGGTFICPKSMNQPKVFARNKTRIENPKEIYAGAIVRASVEAFVYDWKGNVGVSFGLVNVQKLGNGTPISGASSNGEELDELDDLEDDLEDVLN